METDGLALHLQNTENIANSLFETIYISPESPLFTGILFYVSTLLALTLWEEFVVPMLKRSGTLPDIPLVDGQLTETEKAYPFITPQTTSQNVPMLSEFEALDRFFVGSREGVPQYITLKALRTLRGLQTESKEWSIHYDTPVFIYKKNEWG